MARAFAQVAAVVFLIVGVGGFFSGDASHLVRGAASGNFDGVALHTTYLRDVINLAFAAAFVYAGWFARTASARLTVLIAGAVLLAVTIVGFAHSDDAAGTNSVLTLHFPLAMNVFDLATGLLAVLCGLGNEAEPDEVSAA